MKQDKRLTHVYLHIEFSKKLPVILHHLSLIYYTLLQSKFGISHSVTKRFDTLVTNERYFYNIRMLLEDNLCDKKGYIWNPPKPLPKLIQIYFGNRYKNLDYLVRYNKYENKILQQTNNYRNEFSKNISKNNSKKNRKYTKKINMYEYELIQQLYDMLVRFDTEFKVLSKNSKHLGFDYKLTRIQENITRTIKSLYMILIQIKPYIDYEILQELQPYIDRDSMSVVKSFLSM